MSVIFFIGHAEDLLGGKRDLSLAPSSTVSDLDASSSAFSPDPLAMASGNVFVEDDALRSPIHAAALLNMIGRGAEARAAFSSQSRLSLGFDNGLVVSFNFVHDKPASSYAYIPFFANQPIVGFIDGNPVSVDGYQAPLWDPSMADIPHPTPLLLNHDNRSSSCAVLGVEDPYIGIICLRPSGFIFRIVRDHEVLMELPVSGARPTTFFAHEEGLWLASATTLSFYPGYKGSSEERVLISSPVWIDTVWGDAHGAVLSARNQRSTEGDVTALFRYVNRNTRKIEKVFSGPRAKMFVSTRHGNLREGFRYLDFYGRLIESNWVDYKIRVALSDARYYWAPIALVSRNKDKSFSVIDKFGRFVNYAPTFEKASHSWMDPFFAYRGTLFDEAASLFMDGSTLYSLTQGHDGRSLVRDAPSFTISKKEKDIGRTFAHNAMLPTMALVDFASLPSSSSTEPILSIPQQHFHAAKWRHTLVWVSKESGAAGWCNIKTGQQQSLIPEDLSHEYSLRDMLFPVSATPSYATIQYGRDVWVFRVSDGKKVYTIKNINFSRKVDYVFFSEPDASVFYLDFTARTMHFFTSKHHHKDSTMDEASMNEVPMNGAALYGPFPLWPSKDPDYFWSSDSSGQIIIGPISGHVQIWRPLKTLQDGLFYGDKEDICLRIGASASPVYASIHSMSCKYFP